MNAFLTQPIDPRITEAKPGVWLARESGSIEREGGTPAQDAAAGPALVQVFPEWANGATIEIKGGMTPAEVLPLMGPPRRIASHVMTSGIYGVPDEVEEHVGRGTPFEMWEYELWSPGRSVYTTVWLSSSESGDAAAPRVTAVKRQIVTRSLRYRALQSFGRALTAAGVDLD